MTKASWFFFVLFVGAMMLNAVSQGRETKNKQAMAVQSGFIAGVRCVDPEQAERLERENADTPTGN